MIFLKGSTDYGKSLRYVDRHEEWVCPMCLIEGVVKYIRKMQTTCGDHAMEFRYMMKDGNQISDFIWNLLTCDKSREYADSIPMWVDRSKSD